jgi:hypothetical protein
MGLNPTLRKERIWSERKWAGSAAWRSSKMRRACRLAAASRFGVITLIGAVSLLGIAARSARASTYVIYVALDDPVYQELDTLNGLGLLDDYLSEIKPIARVEAARLTLEAERNLYNSEPPNALAQSLIKSMREEFSEEVEWLEQNHEDNPPTMFHPLERVEAQYIYSTGSRRHFPLYGNPVEYQGQEQTPLLPNNDDLPTSVGNNEIMRISNWAGLGGFLAGYAETSVAGPFTRDPIGINNSTTNRFRLLRGAVVASLGNEALSFGDQEMSWGTGFFASLSQGNNARTFPALTLANVHPRLLPGFLRYLGPFRHQIFIGRLDHGRYAEAPATQTAPAIDANYSYPWISGQIITFKPLPTFEFGLDHVIMFGGTNNSNYGWTGWLGRATGLNTGNASQGNTNSRAGVFLKIYLPRLRNTEVYQEILGEDNLTTELRPIGGILPFLSVSYQGGVYIPRVTADGLTDARFEYAIIEPNYSRHSDSLYWAYYSRLMGDPMGPDASEVDLSVNRWINYQYKAGLDMFYTERAPEFTVNGLSKERSGGIAFDLFQIPTGMSIHNFSALGSLRVRAAVEGVHDLNWQRNNDLSMRAVVLISGALTPTWASWIWH